MRLEKLLEKFPPDEEGQRWEGSLLKFEWKLEPDSLFGWKLFITFWVTGQSFYLQGTMKGSTFQDAIQETLLWMRKFRASVLKLHESLAELAPPTALERALEDD
jgi:hypothetical protein